MSILVIGTMAFDDIETPFGNSDHIIGGSASFISLSASYFSEINIVSIVGNDYPETEFSDFKKRKICTEGVQRVRDKKSFYWKGRYHPDMNERDTIETQLNVIEDFVPVIPQSYQSSEFVILGNIAPAAQLSVLDQLEPAQRFIVLDTMNLWINIANPGLLEVLKRVDMLVLNDSEARLLTNEYSLVKASKKIMELGPKSVIIKKGEHGALLFDKQNIFYCPALPFEEVFDPTGAGDSFVGGLVGFLSQAKSVDFDALKNAVVLGSVMASFCIQEFGTLALRNLDAQKINKRLDAFTKLSKYSISSL
ncbi:MAG: PfkB family carbohydrate kinase [Phycisphaerales bacterium]|nr:PfkB family carbohydrate kinase [Phycisphaerales bacterium]